MITTKYVRDNLEEIRKSLERRKSNYPLDKLLKLDEEWRSMQTELQALQAKRNKASLEISKKKKAGEDASKEINALAGVKERIVELESELPTYEDRIQEYLWSLPNCIHESVPAGKDETDNPELRKYGEIKRQRLEKSHEELLLERDLIDLERAAKVSGARFYYLKNELVLLEQSLLRFTLDFFVKKGFIPVIPPAIMRKKYYRGAVPMATFQDALYSVSDPDETEGDKNLERTEEDLLLISTAEHPIVAMHANELLELTKLPIKYVGLGPMFRREAGSHGKDTKGIFRVHQCMQTEQVIFSKQEESWKQMEELIRNIEEIWRKLDIHHRVIEICTGDLAAKDARSYDVEAWIPSQGKYREVGSCSNCTDWQSMRLDIKYDERGERRYVHTLNATGVSSPRSLIAIVENYLNDDGSISIPDLLVPYMGKDRIVRS